MYIVLELQKANKEDTAVGSIINTYTSYNEAESRYYTILAYAALSKLFLHGAYLFSEDGNMVMNKQYIYEEPAPEPEPTPEEETQEEEVEQPVEEPEEEEQ